MYDIRYSACGRWMVMYGDQVIKKDFATEAEAVAFRDNLLSLRLAEQSRYMMTMGHC